MFNWITKYLPKKEQWRLVKTITCDVQVSGMRLETGKVYYHLFESSRHRRRVEITCTIPDVNGPTSGKLMSVYQEKIYRWEHGRHDPTIPSYSQVPEDDTATALRGKVE